MGNPFLRQNNELFVPSPYLLLFKPCTFNICRVLCGIVKNLVSKVAAASASEENNQPGQPDELSQKVSSCPI